MSKIKPFNYDLAHVREMPIKEPPAPVLMVPLSDIAEMIKGKQGEPGDTPTDEKIKELIEPLIPSPKPGENGKTPTKEELLGLIKPLIKKPKDAVDPTDEHLLSLIATLIPTNGLQTAEKTRDMLESLAIGEKLSIEAIEDLAKIIEDLYKKILDLTRYGSSQNGDVKRSIYGGLPKQFRFVDDETPSGTVNGSNTLFTLAHVPDDGTLKIYRGGSRQRIAEDYTLSGKEITFIIPPQAGDIILCDYRR